MFLLLSNYVVVVWLSLGEGRRAELGTGAIAVLVVTLLLIARINIYYFDGYAPRELGFRPVRAFLHQISDRSLFTIPTM